MREFRLVNSICRIKNDHGGLRNDDDSGSSSNNDDKSDAHVETYYVV